MHHLSKLFSFSRFPHPLPLSTTALLMDQDQAPTTPSPKPPRRRWEPIQGYPIGHFASQILAWRWRATVRPCLEIISYGNAHLFFPFFLFFFFISLSSLYLFIYLSWEKASSRILRCGGESLYKGKEITAIIYQQKIHGLICNGIFVAIQVGILEPKFRRPQQPRFESSSSSPSSSSSSTSISKSVHPEQQ